MRTDLSVISVLLVSACALRPPEDTAAERDCEERQLFYADEDGDGYGDADHKILACSEPEEAVDNADDCNDEDASLGLDCDTGV